MGILCSLVLLDFVMVNCTRVIPVKHLERLLYLLVGHLQGWKYNSLHNFYNIRLLLVKKVLESKNTEVEGSI